MLARIQRRFTGKKKKSRPFAPGQSWRTISGGWDPEFILYTFFPLKYQREDHFTNLIKIDSKAEGTVALAHSRATTRIFYTVSFALRLLRCTAMQAKRIQIHL
jgi:hypothetical protein